MRSRGKRIACAKRSALLRGLVLSSAACALTACVSSAPTPVGLISQAQSELEAQANPSLAEGPPPASVAVVPTAPEAPGAPANEALTAQVQTSAEAAANENRIAAAGAAPDAVGTPPATIAAVDNVNNDDTANAIPSTATALAPAPTAANNGGGGFFGSLFGQGNAPRPAAAIQSGNGEAERRARAKQRMRQRANGGGAQQRQVQVATASQAQPRTTNNSALPGVKRRDLFGTIFGSSDDKANEAAEVRVASVAGYALISRNGLIRQHEGVRVSCFKPSLLRVLKQVERKFGKKVIVTSGYRSPKNNRRAGGARNSRHTYCDAADIQVAGVSKWTLAKYLRTLPTRGGVGTYCHTKSVHIDTYKKRDWNWACRKRKRRRG